MEAPSNDEEFNRMLSDTVSGSVFLLAVAFAWRDASDNQRNTGDPLARWDSFTNQVQEMYLNTARRFREHLIEVEDSIDPIPEEVPAL